jgi:hypothetical protein
MALKRGMDVTELKYQVREWLRNKPGPLTQKARELGVSYFWLQRFAKGGLENITTDRLQLLVERMNADRRSAKRQSAASAPGIQT